MSLSSDPLLLQIIPPQMQNYHLIRPFPPLHPARFNHNNTGTPPSYPLSLTPRFSNRPHTSHTPSPQTPTSSLLIPKLTKGRSYFTGIADPSASVYIAWPHAARYTGIYAVRCATLLLSEIGRSEGIFCSCCSRGDFGDVEG